MNKGTITISLEGASFDATERCRLIINTLFEQGVFNIRRGEATLSFDEKGELGSIELRHLKWRRSNPLVPLQNIFDNAKIQIIH